MEGTVPENAGVLGDASPEPVSEPGDSPVTGTTEPVIMVDVDVGAVIPYLTDIIGNQRSAIAILQFFAAFAILWLVYRIFMVAYRFFDSFF